MGILSSLFGRPTPDYGSLITSVAANGGRGIVQVKYDDLVQYLNRNANVIRATNEALIAESSIGGKDCTIFVDRERSAGRDTGRSTISIAAKTPINWDDPEIGNILMQPYKAHIKSQADASNAALAVYYHGTSEIVYDTRADGEMRQGGSSSAVVPAHLKAFVDKFPENQTAKMHDWILSLTQNLTAESPETERRVEVIYAIADALVREYRLVG